MTKNIEFPVWLLLDGDNNDRRKTVNATKLLSKYYLSKYSAEFKKKEINISFTLQTYDADNLTINDETLKHLHDKIYSYINKNQNIFCSYVNRIFLDPKETFSYKTKNKIIFTVGDTSWDEKIPEYMFNLAPLEPTNMEIAKWYSEEKEFNKIHYFHHDHSPPEKYKNIFDKKNKSKFISTEIRSDLVDWEPKLLEVIKTLKNNDLLITNIYLNEPDPDNFGRKFLQLITNENINVDLLDLSTFGDFATHNDNEKINVLKIEEFPWEFFSKEKTLFKLENNSLLHRYFDKYTILQYEFYSMVLGVILSKNISLDDDDFINKIDKAIKTFDGENDIFTGEFETFSFFDRRNTQSENYICTIPPTLFNYENNDNRTNILYSKQLIKSDEIKTVDVHFVYIDIQNVNFIDIKKSIWGVELKIEIVSKIKDPIEILSFKNLSNTDNFCKIDKTNQTEEDQHGFVTTSYNLTGNFSFEAAAQYYPFDAQDVYIEYSIINNSYGLLQPVPKGQLNPNIDINGWNIRRPYSNVKRLKTFHKVGTRLSRKVELNIVSRYGLLLKRYEPANLIKSLAPLSFLTLICYYCLLLPFDRVNNTISFLVTIFLAGTALYFSSDRPQPLTFSLIDKIFQFFYLIVGTNTIYALSVSLDLAVMKDVQNILKYLEPILCIFFIMYVLKRKKDVETVN